MATELGNEEFESVGQWGLWVVHQYAGKACVALAQARNFVRLAAASRDIARCLIGQRIEGVALHYAGQQNAARQRLEAMLEEYSHAIHGWDPVGFQIEHSIVARATLARILWLQASPAEAVSSAEK